VNALFVRPPVDWLGPSPLRDAVFEASSQLAAEPGRRAIVLISDGAATANVHGHGEAIDRRPRPRCR
jgi:hypothetical protein